MTSGSTPTGKPVEETKGKVETKPESTDTDGKDAEESYDEQVARVGGFPPPHVPGEAVSAPYKDALAEATDPDGEPDEVAPTKRTN